MTSAESVGSLPAEHAVRRSFARAYSGYGSLAPAVTRRFCFLTALLKDTAEIWPDFLVYGDKQIDCFFRKF